MALLRTRAALGAVSAAAARARVIAPSLPLPLPLPLSAPVRQALPLLLSQACSRLGGVRASSSSSASPSSSSTANTAPAAGSAAASGSLLAGMGETLRMVMATGKVAKAEKDKAKVASEGTGALDRVSMARLWAFARPELVPLGVSVATLGVTTGISLLFPYAIGQILDVALKADGVLSPGTISAVLLGLFVVQSGMIALRSALLTVSGERIAAHMRRDLFKAIMAQDIAWFDKQRTGDIINRLTSDTVVIQKSLTSNIATGMRSAAMGVGGTAMLFYLSPSLAALSLCLIPPVAVAGITYGRFLQGQQKAVQEALGKTMEVGEELVSSIRTVRQFGAEASSAARFSERVTDAYTKAKRIAVVAAGFDGAVHMAANVSMIAVLWYGGHLVASGGMTAGDLTAFLVYSLYTGFNISSLSTVYSELKRAAGAAARILEIADRPPAMPLSSDATLWASAGADAPDADSVGLLRRGPAATAAAVTAAVTPTRPLRRLETVAGRVEFKDVTFAYPTRADNPVLSRLSLTVPAGRSLALVGGSGSGKSTVGSLLTRLYDVDGGSVTLDGVDVRELDPTWLRSVTGVVAQEPVLFAASVADNIRYGKPGASDEAVVAAARMAHMHDVISAFPAGYATLVGERGIQLSGGQRQRIAIARALLRDPAVLLFDEATSSLDSDSEAAILAALDQATRGRTVISIAHRLSTMRHADMVAVLSGGTIVEVGPFDTLFNNPASAFRALVDKQLLR